MLRELIESHQFTQNLAAIGDAERMDDVLTGVKWALASNPEAYDVVRGLVDIRLVKTRPFPGAPMLRIWFRIDEDGHHVHLEDVEAIESEA
ncbi:MAG TPA: hypothetical protein VHC20_06855 [Candidatus Paceibacterota bacterium]|nr:hypothetical protein [Candidatus Paceibacterota bacterium]